MRKKKFEPKWYHWLLRAMMDLLLLPFALLALPYFLLVVFPVERTIETEPLYWLTWKQVKQKSRKRTSQVLHTLLLAARPEGRFDCRLRPEEELTRLERFLKRKRPTSKVPYSYDDTVFYCFRRKPGGGARRLPQFFFHRSLAQIPA